MGTRSGGSPTIRGSPSTILGELVERREAVLGAGLRDVPLEALLRLGAHLGADAAHEVLDVDARVPDVHRAHRRELGHRLAVGLRDRDVDRQPAGGVEAAVAPGDGEARDEPLQVPLERPGQRLVEVVHVEDEPAVGRGVAAEVREMRVAAELRVKPGARRSGEIGRHQVGSAAEERERRDEHPPVPDRDELGHAARGLLLEQLDRVGADRRRLPLGVSGPRHLGARGLAASRALGRP